MQSDPLVVKRSGRGSVSARVFSTGQVAEFCRVDPRTVLRWVKRGQLKAFQLPGRGDHRVEYEDLLAFLQEHDMPIPVGLQLCKPGVMVVDTDGAVWDGIQGLEPSLGVDLLRATSWLEAGVLLEREAPQYVLVALKGEQPALRFSAVNACAKMQAMGVWVLGIELSEPWPAVSGPISEIERCRPGEAPDKLKEALRDRTSRPAAAS